MYYKFEYQNDDYLINLDKIEYVIKSNDEKCVYVFLSNKRLQFGFNTKEEMESFYEELKKAIIENLKIKE